MAQATLIAFTAPCNSTANLQLRRSALPRPSRRYQAQRQQQARRVTRMGLKAVESFDGSFTLDTASREVLFTLLHSDAFRQQVVQQCGLPEGTQVAFTELLFQPVPWSPTTRKGMPAEFEQYHEDPGHTIVNVPPHYMFQAKIFKPSRLCAVFKHIS